MGKNFEMREINEAVLWYEMDKDIKAMFYYESDACDQCEHRLYCMDICYKKSQPQKDESLRIAPTRLL